MYGSTSGKIVPSQQQPGRTLAVVNQKYSIEQPLHLLKEILHAPARQHLVPQYRWYRMTDIHILIYRILQLVLRQPISECPHQLLDVSAQIRLRCHIEHIIRTQIPVICTCLCLDTPLVVYISGILVKYRRQTILHFRIGFLNMGKHIRRQYIRPLHFQSSNQQVTADKIIQFGIAARNLERYRIIGPTGNNLRTVAIHPIVSYQYGSAFGFHLLHAVQPVQMRIQFRIGSISQLQCYLVGIFSILGNQRILTFHLNGKILRKYGLHTVNKQFSHNQPS